ncbi:hydroxysteroid 11-beta-dehydrogenase 1-like protein isoform X3 [Vulpes lagopus]|uniref:hydroxysteroid 11-beta-dehydrogenase 1-like protein isoform X3 n=1 Tax=Vulpes lagopus TaxID=494514 RepID=UPI001BC94B94|nr:hydroxysteroid 11-beta-dehydrogenase 1-like protein isoform X3 [Vulpes lagopus]
MKVLLLTGLGALFFSYYWDDNFDPASLQGARVLLTGASAGVGEELAYHYARLGSHLVLTAHTEAFLQKVVGNCRKLGAPEVFYIAADMASPEVPGRVVQFALDKLVQGDGAQGRGLFEDWLLADGPLRARRAGLPRAEPPRRHPGRHAVPERPGDTLAPAGELAELRAADLAGAAQPDRQQRLPGGRVLAARPRAHVLLQPVLGGQVRAGRLLRLPAAGAGRAGRERGHHRVCPGPPGPRLGRRGSQRLLPVALPPAGPAPGMAAAPEGLVHPPGAQRHRCRRCRCLSSRGGAPSSSQRGALHPAVPERRHPSRHL